MKITIRFILVFVGFATGFGRLSAAPATIPLKAEMLSAYVKAADAFANDDLAAAKSAAAKLADNADIADQHIVMKQAGAVAKAADLSAAREAFKPLSLSMEPLAAGESGYVIMTCSMANADWVQLSGDVKNPYFGKSMQTCGEPKKIDAAPSHGSHGCGDDHKGCG